MKMQQPACKKDQQQQLLAKEDLQRSLDVQQFQSTYFTLKEARPELFENDRAAQFIKVDGMIESIASDMENFALLHQGLDTSQVPHAGNASYLNETSQIATVQLSGKEKLEEYMKLSRAVWEKWWEKKLRNNQQMLAEVKRGNYEEVVKLIDCNYNDDLVASINYQEPQTGYTALHYAVKLGNYQLMHLLLSNEADCLVQDAKGQTPLHLACIKGDLEAYKMLVGRSFHAKNSLDKALKTALDYAYEAKCQPIITFDQKTTETLFQYHRSQSSGPASPRSDGAGFDKKLSVDDFEFIMYLGRGAFGDVKLVQKDKHYYAMKIMKKRKYNGLLNLVLTEKEVYRKVRSRFVVQLKYAFQTFDKLYLVTEYCHGGDMRHLLNQKKKLNESEARLYLAEILVALEELHKHGVIHRDVKLDNILLDKEGHIKLTDFGLSKDGMFEKKLTDTMLGGGRSYQIPEVIMEQAYDKSVDIYLFGILTYELMTGMPAFPPDLPELETNILKSQYRVPTELTPEARDLIQKLIVVNPQARMHIRQIKKQPFFAKTNWQQVAEGKLKMPKPHIRPVQKQEQLRDEESSDDDNLQAQEQNSFEEGGDLPGEARNGEEIKLPDDDDDHMDFVFDDKQGNWVPKMMSTDLKDMGNFGGKAKHNFNEDLMNSNHPQSLMDVPNFYYSQDLSHHQYDISH